MNADRSWSHRFMAALPPSELAMTLFFVVMAFVCGVLTGMVLDATRKVNHHAREAERLIAQLPSRPTLHQRLDAIDQRLQAIEQRLTPHPRRTRHASDG